MVAFGSAWNLRSEAACLAAGHSACRPGMEVARRQGIARARKHSSRPRSRADLTRTATMVKTHQQRWRGCRGGRGHAFRSSAASGTLDGRAAGSDQSTAPAHRRRASGNQTGPAPLLY